MLMPLALSGLLGHDGHGEDDQGFVHGEILQRREGGRAGATMPSTTNPSSDSVDPSAALRVETLGYSGFLESFRPSTVSSSSVAW